VEPLTRAGGRVDECIAEDPYLVGAFGTSFVRGLQSQGVLATLKHFVGYSASARRAELAPGPRRAPRDRRRLLIPSNAILTAMPSVMHSYAEIDGVPVAADPSLLTGVLRDRWGLRRHRRRDYFGVAFLHLLHHVAADLGQARPRPWLPESTSSCPPATRTRVRSRH
jgi:beta-glucosidase